MENMTPADLFALQNEGGNMNWIWILFLFFFAFGGNGFGFGSNRQYATQDDVQRGFDNSNVINKLDGLNESVIGIGSQMAQGFCGIERNIDSIRYDAALNTTNITNAIHAEGEATRTMFRENEIQTLRDQLQSANLTLAQAQQTQNLLNNLRPFPQPAYLTCSPYASAANNCGCGI